MTNNAPDSLIMPAEKRITAFKLSKWPLYVVLLGAGLLVAVLVYSVNFAHNEKGGDDKAKPVEISEQEKPLLMGEGKGLALLPPTNTALVQPDLPTPGGRKDPLIVVQKPQDYSEQYRQELETLRRKKAQAQLEALSAPLAVKKADASTNRYPAENEAGAGRAAASPGSPGVNIPAQPSENYDPAAAKDKEGFLGRAAADTSWTLPHERTPGQKYELKTGAVIPAALVTGINSELPGQIIGQVSQNVYDSAWGKHLLIPQGAKLVGVYDSRVAYGQSRVLVAWNRIVFPDGSSITLGAMPGADESGYAGYEDKVNNHYLRIFGSAFVMSLITGGTAYAVDSLDPSSGNNNTPSMQQQMGTALASQLGQTSMRLLEKNISIAPTLEIRPGYAFNVVITKDVVFERAYKAWR